MCSRGLIQKYMETKDEKIVFGWYSRYQVMLALFLWILMALISGLGSIISWRISGEFDNLEQILAAIFGVTCFVVVLTLMIASWKFSVARRTKELTFIRGLMQQNGSLLLLNEKELQLLDEQTSNSLKLLEVEPNKTFMSYLLN